MCVIERNPKPPRLQKVSNVLTTNTNMKKLSSENLLGMHGAEDAGSVENFGAITVSFLPVAMDFRRPDSLGQQGISNESFFSLEEIRAKFPDVPIYEFSYEDVQYHFVP